MPGDRLFENRYACGGLRFQGGRRGRGPQIGGPASTPHRISLRLPARLLRLPLKGGVIPEACIRSSSITPPLRGSRREGGARSRAGGGQTPRPVSQYQQYAKQRQSPWCPLVVAFVPLRGSAFFGRPRGPASTPHRISLRLPAQLLRLPLKGGVIGQWRSRRCCDFPSRGE